MHNIQKHACRANSQNALTINGSLKILDWKDGDLGITLQEKDIDKVKKKVKTAETIPSPTVLDLNGDGVTTNAVGTGAHFDYEADGYAESTGWVSSQDGLLARDLNADGKINIGRELFGSETLLSSGKKAANGFEALRELDSSADDQGNQHLQLGSYTNTTGITRSATDVWFKVDRTYSVSVDMVRAKAKSSKRACATKSIAARAYSTIAGARKGHQTRVSACSSVTRISQGREFK